MEVALILYHIVTKLAIGLDVYLFLSYFFRWKEIKKSIFQNPLKWIKRLILVLLGYISCTLVANGIYFSLFQNYLFAYNTKGILRGVMELQAVLLYGILGVAVFGGILYQKRVQKENVIAMSIIVMEALLCKDFAIVHLFVLWRNNRMNEITLLVLYIVLIVAIVENNQFFLFWKKKRASNETISDGYTPDVSMYEYYAEMEEMHGTIRKLHHDMKNHLMVLDQVGEGEQGENMQRLNEQLSSMDDFYNTGMVHLNMLLFQKHKVAKQNEIGFEVQIQKNELNFMNAADVCTIFGDALDNALEACMGKMGQFIEVKAGNMGNDVVIIFSNTMDKKLENNDKKQILQTKKKDTFYHGIGISSIQSVVKYYSGSVKIAVKDGKFRMTIIIPRKEEA